MHAVKAAVAAAVVVACPSHVEALSEGTRFTRHLLSSGVYMCYVALSCWACAAAGRAFVLRVVSLRI